MNTSFIRISKILVPIIIIIFLISGCKAQINETSTLRPDISINPDLNSTVNPNPGNESNSPSLSPSVTIPGDVSEAASMNIIYTADNTGKYFRLSDWQTYIHEKLGVEIIVDYRILNADYIYDENIELDGVLYLKYPDAAAYAYNTEVLRLSNGDFAYDLSPYYEKYGWDEFLDKQYLDPLIINGSIYAVPAYSDRFIVPRYYNKTYLTELNLVVPDTIPKFYEYLLKTKEMNAADDTFYPMVIFPLLTPCTADIFRAFNVYVDSKTNNARVFNPNTNSFEDGIFSENIEDALGFIRQLQNEELLLVYDMPGQTEHGVFNKELATEYNIVFDIKKFGFAPYFATESAYERASGYYLTHLNNTNVCEIRNEIAFYMFPKAMKNINGTLELFNRLFTDTQYYADLRFGIEDIDYYVINGMPLKQEPLTGVLLNLKQIKPVYNAEAALVPESVAIAETISAKLSFESNVFNQKYTYLDNGYKRDPNQDNAIEYLFDKTLSPYDAIEKYRDDFVKQGRLAILNELNERIGAVSMYDYGN